MSTLTLNPGAVKLNVELVCIVLVTGTTLSGPVDGELLAVSAPVRIWAVPVVAMVVNVVGMTKVRVLDVETVFEICKAVDSQHLRAISCSLRRMRLYWA